MWKLRSLTSLMESSFMESAVKAFQDSGKVTLHARQWERKVTTSTCVYTNTSSLLPLFKVAVPGKSFRAGDIAAKTLGKAELKVNGKQLISTYLLSTSKCGMEISPSFEGNFKYISTGWLDSRISNTMVTSWWILSLKTIMFSRL